ncbi:squalene--hopene cyclase [Pseudomonas sp. B6002]|uniref:squalene--hopene cyclase n=1 Tax=Pseudomonas sp. B6002 TaxID=2726978 RepID=UPI0015A47E67|nr:squalene--hopene cyclase [Pseudomonas sp. B6002]NVZ53034.1 squalene--hopene cyclase [Pseudomonas sp. B6002]
MNPRLECAIEDALNALLLRQRPDGHWVFELETDAAMTAEYVLQMHFLGEPIDPILGAKLARYMSDLQQPEGGWPVLQGGHFDLSTSVKTYFALKLLGRAENEQPLQRACALIRQHGGAAGSNVMTRIWMALFGFIPWHALPSVPVEVILLPRWFPFHLSKIACLPRKYTVAFSVLHVSRPIARNPQRTSIAELFLEPPEQTRPLRCAPHQNKAWFALFGGIDRLLHRCTPWFPKGLRQKAIDRAVSSVIAQLNGEDGYGATLPTIGASVILLRALNYPDDHPAVLTARKARDKLLVIHPQAAYCQPCVSPIWDTAWVCQALLETGEKRGIESASHGLKWLRYKQILDTYGDWVMTRPDLRPGGWAFQYNLPRHPDVDDTAVVATVMQRALCTNPTADYGEAISRAREWVEGMQNRQGGWGAYEAENTQNYLNSFPIAEHGLMIDFPSADVSARCLCMLGLLEATPATRHVTDKALHYLLAQQEADGSWYGRWGINFIYGTWSALEGLATNGHDPQFPAVRRAREWLIKHQNSDGGWGENASGYALKRQGHQPSESTPSQTAWALLGLMVAGAVNHPATRRGIAYLQQSQHHDGTWTDGHATGTGIPRAMYLHYHGYAVYFPLWALARYRNLTIEED